MITVRSEDGLMMHRFTGIYEKAMHNMIMTGAIPNRSVTLKSDSKEDRGFELTDHYKWELGGVTLYLWKGSQVLMRDE